MAKQASKNKPSARKASPKPAAKAAKPPVKLASKPVVKAGRKAADDVARPKPSAMPMPSRRPREIVEEPAVMAPPPTPVPTDGKPRKNQAGLTTKELEHFRELLLQKRRELVGDMSQMEREALRSASGSNLSNLPLHMADMGTDNYEQEFTLGLVEKDRDILFQINQALAKIQDGSYGICAGTGKPISKVRLEAQPWARYSIEYARKKEKGFIR